MGNKVLFVNDGHTYQSGEGNYYGVHYNEKIKKRYLQLGETVTFATRLRTITNAAGKGYSKISNENFNFIEIPDFKSIKKYFLNRFRAQKIIEEAVRKHDILVTRLPSASGTMAVKTARKYNIPYLVEYVGCTFDSYWNYNWKGKLIAHYKMLEQKQVIKDCPHVIYVTKEFLQKRYPTKGKSINCSNVELTEFNEDDLGNKINRLNNIDDEITIGTVAALDVPYKGQADVIRALANVKNQNSINYHFKYILIGQGNPKNLLHLIKELNLEDDVEVKGALPHNEIFSYLENIDLYIQPSKQEGLPRALIEAMSKACPALGARTAGIPELIDNECIFTPGSEREIAEKLNSLTIADLISWSKMNFETAKDYRIEILESRRKNFYRLFLEENNLAS